MTDTAEIQSFFVGALVNGTGNGDDRAQGLRLVWELPDEHDLRSLILVGDHQGNKEWLPAEHFVILEKGAGAKELAEVYGNGIHHGDYSFLIREIDRTSNMMKVTEIRDGAVTYEHGNWVPWAASAFSGVWTHYALIAVMENLARISARSALMTAISIPESAFEPAVDESKRPLFKIGELVKPVMDDAQWAPRVVLSRRITSNGVPVYLLATGNGNTAEYSKPLELVASDANEYMRQGVFRQRDELVNFKAAVGAAARKAKKEHGWCEEVDDVLRELEVPILTEMLTVVLNITVEIEVKPTADGQAMDKLTDFDWFARSLKVGSDDEQIQIVPDSDFEDDDIEVRIISHKVTDVTDTSYAED